MRFWQWLVYLLKEMRRAERRRGDEVLERWASLTPEEQEQEDRQDTMAW